MGEIGDGQELDRLLITVDSEIGNLRGINSAINALQRLQGLTGNAKGAIKQLGDLGVALKEFDGIGHKLDGIDNVTSGVHRMITALQRLSQVTGSANKAIKQLGVLGTTLNTSFNGIGQNLAGIENVSRGILDLVTAVDRLTQVTGNANSASRQLGNLGTQLQNFNNVNLTNIANNIAQPLEQIMNAIGNLGNNNRVSIRIDQSGVANVNRINNSLNRAMTSFSEFENAMRHDMANVSAMFGDMFDTTQPVADLRRNLAQAQRLLTTYENNARTAAQRVNDALSMYGNNGAITPYLEGRGNFRNAYRDSHMFEAMADEVRRGIDDIRNEIETRGAQEIVDAWQHTEDAIAQHIGQFSLAQYMDFSLPVDQLSANLRRMQNELSRSENAMQRALANMNRLRAETQDENVLHGRAEFRGSHYTYQTEIHNINEYRNAIQQLQDAINNQRTLPTNEDEAQRMRTMAQLTQQLREYTAMYDNLRNVENPNDDQQRDIRVIENGLTIINARLDAIRSTLGTFPRTEEGVLERMRQIADEAERTNRELQQARDASAQTVSRGFGDFGSALSGLDIPVLRELGNLSSLFGRNGARFLDAESLAGLEGIASTLGTVATAIGQVTAVLSVAVAAFQVWWKTMNKVRDALSEFIQSCVQFARNMLSTVVGAFNAVAGAVGKAVSVVRSGAEAVATAMRKMGDAVQSLLSILGKIGGALAPAMKGVTAVLSTITPRFVKNLASADGSIKNIIKNTRVLNKLLQITNKWTTMLTRMLMRKIVQAFISGLKQAFEDLVLFEMNASDEMMKLNENVSLIFSGLRRAANQWIAAFEPLINFITPMVVGFLEGVQTMGEAFAKFMAILTGQPYYIRAKLFYQNYGEEVEKANKKVKNLTNGLDELNILNDNKDNDSGIKPEDMFEKVYIDDVFELPSLQEFIDKIVDWLKNIDWEKIWEKIREIIHKAMEIINEILSRLDLWEWLGKTLGNLFNTLMVAWNQFITDFDPKLLADALTTFIINALQTINWDLIHENIELTAKKFAQFWNEIFANQALWDEIAKAITNFLNEIVHYFDTWAWTFDFAQMAQTLTDAITKILNNFDWEQLRHAVEGWVAGLVNFINTAIANKEFWKALGQTVEHIINDVLIEAIKNLANIDLVGLSDSIKIAITNALDNIHWEDFTASIKKIATDLANAINNIFGDEQFLTLIATSAAKFVNALINGIYDFLTNLNPYEIATAISNAIQSGLALIDWDKIFKIPAEAINAITNFIRGILDSLPEDFSLADWIISHLKITYENIDWEGIKANLYELGSKIVDFINDVIGSDDFWNMFGELSVLALDLIVKVTADLTEIDWAGLAERITNYINNLIDQNKVDDIIRNIGTIAIDLFFSISAVIHGVDWDALGKQIADGIADVIDKLYLDADKIQQAIEDAFQSFSDLVSSTLQNLLKKNAFYKLGTVIGNLILGIINGLAIFFDDNSGNIVASMKQFADGLANFIHQHRDEIIASLNKIIDAIVSIMDEFFNEKGKLWTELNYIIEKLNLGKLIGSFIRNFLLKILAVLKTNTAISNALKEGLDEIAKEVAGALKKWGKYFLERLLYYLADWKPVNIKFGEWIADKIKGWLGIDVDTSGLKPFSVQLGEWIADLILGKDRKGIDLSKIFDKLKFTGLEDAWNKLKAKWNEVVAWFKKKWQGVKDFFGGLFGGKEAEVPVTITPTIKEDDSKLKLEDVTQNVELQFEDAKLGKITATTIEAEKFVGDILKVKDIYADLLTVTDIVATKLKVDEIEGNFSGGSYRQQENLAGNNNTVQSGTLNKDLDVNTITAELLKVAEIISELITTQLLHADEIRTGEINAHVLNVSTINADVLNVDRIIANTLTLGSIIADRLNVGTISGNLSGLTGGTSTVSYPSGGTSYIGRTSYEPIGRTSYPTGYTTGGTTRTGRTGLRWSDISGGYSAEDYLYGYTKKGTSRTIGGGKNGNSSMQYIYDYLYDVIGNEAGTLGLMGNLFGESGLKTNNLQDTANKKLGMTDKEYTDYINNGGNFLDNRGYGLAQWTTKDRKKGLLDYADGRDISDIDVQLGYLVKELQEDFPQVLKKLQNANDLLEATSIALREFEKPDDQSDAQLEKRLAHAENLLEQLANGNGNENTNTGRYTMPRYADDNTVGAQTGTLNKDNVADLFPDGILSDDDVEKIHFRLGTIWTYLIEFVDKYKQVLDDFNFAELFLSEEDLATIEKRLDDVEKLIDDFLKRTRDAIQKFHDTIKEMFDDLVKGFLDGLKERADEELASVLRTIRYYAQWIQDEFDEITDSAKKIFEGLTESAQQELAKLVQAVVDCFKQINDEIKNLNMDALKLFEGVADAVKEELEKTLAVVVEYFNKIRDEINKLNEDALKLFEGLADAVKEELEKVLDVVTEYSKKIQDELNKIKNIALHLFDGMADEAKKEFEKLLALVAEYVKKIQDELNKVKNTALHLFDNMTEAARKEFEKLLALVIEYVKKIQDELNKIKSVALHLFDGMTEAARKEFEKLLALVIEYLAKIKAEFDKFRNTIQNLFSGLADAFKKEMEKLIAIANDVMAQVYDIIDTWLGRIYMLLSSFKTPNIFAGLAEALKAELDKAYKYVEEWVAKVKAKLNEIFAPFQSILNGELKIRCECNCNCNCGSGNDIHLINNTNAKSKNTQAVERLTEIMRGIQGGISANCVCNCNCGGNCGDCAAGQKTVNVTSPIVNTGVSSYPRTGIVDNDIVPKPVVGTTGGTGDINDYRRTVPSGNTGGTTNPSTPSGNTGGTTNPSTPSVGGTGGGGYIPSTPSTVGTSGGDGNQKIHLQQGNRQVRLYANIGGKLVMLDESNLTAAQKAAIASGKYAITDIAGTPLSSTDRNNTLKLLKQRGWLGTGSSTSGGGKSGTTGGGTGGTSGGGKGGTTGGGKGDSKGNTGGTSKGSGDTKGSTGGTSGGGKGGNTGGSTGGNERYGFSNGSGSYDLYVTLDGQRKKAQDLTPEEKKRVANGEGTFDLNGQPLENFKGVKDAAGRDVSDPNMWRKDIADGIKGMGTGTGGQTANLGSNDVKANSGTLSKADSTKNSDKNASTNGNNKTATNSNTNKGTNSDEEFVRGLYKSILGREADAEGLKYWLDALKNGMSREDVKKGFYNSQEYKNKLKSLQDQAKKLQDQVKNSGTKTDAQLKSANDLANSIKNGADLPNAQKALDNLKNVASTVDKSDKSAVANNKTKAQDLANKVKNSSTATADQKKQAQSLLDSINKDGNAKTSNDSLGKLQNLADTVKKSDDKALSDYKNKAKTLADQVKNGATATDKQLKNATDLYNSINKATDPATAKKSLNDLQKLADTVNKSDKSAIDSNKKKAQDLANKIKNSGTATDAQKKQAQSLLDSISKDTNAKNSNTNLGKLQSLSDAVAKSDKTALDNYKKQAQTLANKINNSGTGTADQKKQAQNLLNSVNSATDPTKAKGSLDSLQKLSDTVAKSDKAATDNYKKQAQTLADKVKNSGTATDAQKKQAQSLLDSINKDSNAKTSKTNLDKLQGLSDTVAKSDKAAIDSYKKQAQDLANKVKNSGTGTTDQKKQAQSLLDSINKDTNAKTSKTNLDKLQNLANTVNNQDAKALTDKKNEAKKYLDEVNKSSVASADQKKQAQNYYNAINSATNVNSTTANLNSLKKLADETKVTAELQKAFNVINSDYDLYDMVGFGTNQNGYEYKVGSFKLRKTNSDPKVSPYGAEVWAEAYQEDVAKLNSMLGKPISVFKIGNIEVKGEQAQSAFDYWYNNSFKVRGYAMGGTPDAGELFVARENGTPEFVGSFGGHTAVANNDQIVTAVANGVSMANDRMVSAIENQTNALENAIDRKNLDVQIGDRQIAEANNRGQKGLGNKFVD